MLEPRRWENEKRLDIQVQKQTETNAQMKFLCAVVLMLFFKRVSEEAQAAQLLKRQKSGPFSLLLPPMKRELYQTYYQELASKKVNNKILELRLRNRIIPHMNLINEQARIQYKNLSLPKNFEEKQSLILCAKNGLSLSRGLATLKRQEKEAREKLSLKLQMEKTLRKNQL